jgi:hypothetical protein
MGTKLIQHFSMFTENFAEIGPELRITGGWSEKIFIEKRRNVRNFRYALTLREDDFLKMRVFLLEKREMMLQLLENPNLLEHDTFTELLLAVFHLTDELQYRGSFENLPKPDYEHLKGDINRAYALIITEWLAYMNYLRKDYPYLYSLAVRTNPFNPEASITVS